VSLRLVHDGVEAQMAIADTTMVQIDGSPKSTTGLPVRRASRTEWIREMACPSASHQWRRLSVPHHQRLMPWGMPVGRNQPQPAIAKHVMFSIHRLRWGERSPIIDEDDKRS
jgi:hypothetical protein